MKALAPCGHDECPPHCCHQTNDPLIPSASLLIKLGSIIVHQEEYMSSKGNYFDKLAIATLRNDPEVVEWMAQMNKMALLPVKR